MANIPKLKDNVSASASTGKVDRSGVLREEQRGLSDFNQFLQTAIKTGEKYVDSKVYASESTRGQGELLDFMSETKNEKLKSDYFKDNNGDMTGYAEFRAKKNMDVMQKKLSTISHPKARKELERQMSHQAQKSLLSDMNDENRIVQNLVQEREVVKNQILATEINEMKSPGDAAEYELALTNRLAEIQENTNNGLIDPAKAVKMRASVLDDSANLRARALIEGGSPLEAMKSVRTNRFGTVSQQQSTRNYITSKHLDGKKKGYEALKQQNNIAREQREAQTHAIDVETQNILNNERLSSEEKLAATRSLRLKYKGTLNAKQAKLLSNADYETSRNTMSLLLANVNSIPYDEADTATFKNATNQLRGIVANENVPAKARKEASNAINSVIKKQKLHETLVEKKAWAPLQKGNILDKRSHKNIINKIAENPKYADLPVEAEVEIYKLYASGKDKKFISFLGKSIESRGSEPFKMSADKALEIHNKKPEIFDKLMMRMIKKNRPSLSKTGIERKFKQFKRSFDDYKDKVDNFETQEKAILDKFKGLQ